MHQNVERNALCVAPESSPVVGPDQAPQLRPDHEALAFGGEFLLLFRHNAAVGVVLLHLIAPGGQVTNRLIVAVLEAGLPGLQFLHGPGFGGRSSPPFSDGGLRGFQLRGDLLVPLLQTGFQGFETLCLQSRQAGGLDALQAGECRSHERFGEAGGVLREDPDFSFGIGSAVR